MLLLFLAFIIAGGLVTLASRPKWYRRRRKLKIRPEGTVLVVAVLLSIGIGLSLSRSVLQADPTTRGVIPFSPEFLILILTGLLYALTAWRTQRGLPASISDLILLLAAGATVLMFPDATVRILRSPTAAEYIRLGQWEIPLTIAWIWAVARMTAALNRMPQVTGGYLGIVALTLLAVLLLDARNASVFPPLASAALAGAGLATIPIALRRRAFDLGWSASLAMGFLLAQISIVGLLKNTTFAILILSLLTFGLPILDVTFFRLRTALRGKKVSWEEQRLRLHEALLRRGVAPSRIALLYTAIGFWLCGMGVLMARFVFVAQVAPWRIGLRLFVIAALLFAGFVFFFSIARILMRRVPGEDVPEDVEAFGVRISAVSMQEALDKIEGFIQTKTPHHVVTSDANAILRAQQDTEYADIIRRAALITPDGFGVIWGARLMNLPIYERVTGVDMVTGICERAAKNDYSIYIFGSSPGIAATAAQKLAEKYPGLKVVGTHHGMVLKKPDELAAVVQQIKAAKPDVLFVALGIPLQEKFIAKHLHELNVPVALGVGGSFDVYSEKLKRAPEYIQRSGMEWLYRVWQEPWRWKRMSYVPKFMAFALREWLFGSNRPKSDVKNTVKPSSAAP